VDVARLAQNDKLPEAAAQTLNTAAQALVSDLSARLARLRSKSVTSLMKKIGASLPTAR
jgi:hypothetical protein